MSEAYKIRPGNVTDLPFIFKSWLLGQYHGNRPIKGFKNSQAPLDYFSSIDQDTFMANYHKYIEMVLKVASVNVACLASDEDVVLGYSVIFNTTLVWVFVKPDWRKIGIAKSLVPDTIKVVGSITRVGDSIRRKRGWSFNPFL